MSGYNYSAGMSNRAVAAYNSGLSPLSRITIAELRFVGWRETKALAVALARAGHWQRAEWHHTGGTWFNATDFFDPRDLVEFWDDLTSEERRKIKSELTAKKPPCEAVKVRCEYTVWGGSRRKPRRMGEQAFTGTKIGDWIELDGGGRKKASGRWINWEVVT